MTNSSVGGPDDGAEEYADDPGMSNWTSATVDDSNVHIVGGFSMGHALNPDRPEDDTIVLKFLTLDVDNFSTEQRASYDLRSTQPTAEANTDGFWDTLPTKEILLVVTPDGINKITMTLAQDIFCPQLIAQLGLTIATHECGSEHRND